MTKLLVIASLPIGVWRFQDNLVLLVLSICLILIIAFLSDINITIRRTGKRIELGYSIMTFFYPSQHFEASELKGLEIKQNHKKYYIIGFLTNSDEFFVLDKRPTLDKSQEVKKEIQKKIVENWSQR